MYNSQFHIPWIQIHEQFRISLTNPINPTLSKSRTRACSTTKSWRDLLWPAQFDNPTAKVKLWYVPNSCWISPRWPEAIPPFKYVEDDVWTCFIQTFRFIFHVLGNFPLTAAEEGYEGRLEKVERRNRTPFLKRRHVHDLTLFGHSTKINRRIVRRRNRRTKSSCLFQRSLEEILLQDSTQLLSCLRI